MRCLYLHCNYIEWEPKQKAIEKAEEIEKKEKVRVEECLAILTTVEKDDVKDVEGIVRAFVKNAEEIAGMVKASRIVVYPYAHLSKDLASPEAAAEILRKCAEALKEKGYEVYRAPFGWYKRLSLDVKGHPLAELSRRFGPEKEEVKEEKIEKSRWFQRFVIIDVDGSEYEIEPTEESIESCPVFKKGKRYELLKIFVRNELIGKKGEGVPPKHIEYMRKLELVDYCPESDVGHFKWYPNGALIRDLLVDYALYKIALPWGAFKMVNPLMYRRDIESIRKLQGEFHERDYNLEADGKPLVLRFASDPGAFPFVQKVLFTYRHTPLKVYEEAICFRKEQSGECVGLFRVRNFLMTDQHAFCISEEQAMEEYIKLSMLFGKLMNEIAGEYWVLGWEAVEEYYEKYKDKIFKRIVKELRVPAFIKIMKEMKHYWAFKSEYQVISLDGSNVQVATVQWDVKNGARFNICYIDEKGEKKPIPIILHASSIGSIERALASILERAAWMEKEGKLPMLPLWLSPEQVRVIPVSEEYLEYARRIAKEIASHNIRVGLDDRDLSLAKKVLEAKRRWIPYIIVIGKKEVESGKLSVTIREKSDMNRDYIVEMSVEELVKEIKEKCKDKPFRPMYLPMEVSKRPIFVPWGGE